MPQKRTPAALSRLRAIATIRPEFIGVESVDELTAIGASLALKHTNAQAASVFLFDQVGRLTRTTLVGWDKDGNAISNDSIRPESHYPGQSFTGQVATLREGAFFGEAQWSNAVERRRDVSVREEYSEVLGGLRAAVSIPLNGNHRTFGALEAVNKTGTEESFNFEDAHWLSLIANELALAISHARRMSRSAVLHQLAEAVVSMFLSTTEEESVYRNVARNLTRPPLPYRVCIIRLRRNSDLVSVAAESCEVSMAGRDESPIESSHALADVLQARERVYIESIHDSRLAEEYLLNRQWALDNGLVSYACLPLVVDKEIQGAISFYFGFRYCIDNDEWEFFESLARFLAAFCNGRRVLRDVEEMVRQDALDAAMAEYDGDPDKHTFAEFLNGTLTVLNGLDGENLGSAAGKKEFDRIFSMIETKLEQVRREISEPDVVDLNELIASIVAVRRRIPMKTHIQFTTKLRKVPLILARASDLRHVVKDLIANAVKSIQRKSAGFGLIIIETRISKDKDGAERIELIVEDTGEGIPKEDLERIFDRGFTSHKDKGGTGVGLFLARSVISSLSGTIRVVSRVGEGSVFHVVIPQWQCTES